MTILIVIGNFQFSQGKFSQVLEVAGNAVGGMGNACDGDDHD